MATPNLAPRGNEEGNIGTSTLNWLKGWFKNLFVSGNITDGTNNVTVSEIRNQIDNPSVPTASEINTDDSGVTVQEALDAVEADLSSHESDTTNPHAVTATQVDTDVSGESVQDHINAIDNPHTVTKTQVGLSNVDNVQQIPLSYLDTDDALAADSDVKVPSQSAVKSYIDVLLGANDAMTYKGVIDCSTNPDYPAGDAGDTYRISVAGKIGGASGENVEVGDMAICLTDSTASGDQATVGSNWNIIQVNIDGNVVGTSPYSSVDDNLVMFNGTSGKVIEDSGLALSTVTGHIDSTANPHEVSADQVDTDTSGESVQDHIDDTTNPHSVTKTQVGLGNVENVDTTDANNIDTDDSGVTVQEALDAVESDVSTNTSDITNLKKSAVSFVIDGGGSEITTGVKGDLLVPFGGTITKVTLLADQSGSIVVDIWKDTYANFSPTDADSICDGSGVTPPTISGAIKSQDSTLSGWTTSVSEDDILRFNVDSITTIERVTIILEITRS